uniref:M20_dimer domain-containing protein n=1 Tax=Panagrellus redivivus TaxID=6233 RepID=A0A7E4W7K8_PANRE
MSFTAHTFRCDFGFVVTNELKNCIREPVSIEATTTVCELVSVDFKSSSKLTIPSTTMSFPEIFAAIDKKQTAFIERLREAVEIPSVSADAAYRKDVFRMIDWTQKALEKLGATCEQIPNGKQKLADGKEIDLPPVLFGVLGKDPKKKTVLVYGHLDVQPAHKDDGWDTEPFKLIEKDGKLYGRGSTDDKGPVIGWINAIETLQELKVELPVNVKFVLEGMEESGSEGLDAILINHKDTFLKDVDFTCISDNYWLGKKTPCITYGLRGICYYLVEINVCKQDLHSGVFGGTVYDGMSDLTWVLSQLVDVDGTIKIDGISDLVAPVTDDERALYEKIDFDVKSYADDIKAHSLVTNDKIKVLMNRWRYPALSVHGIEGAFSGPGAKTVIPSKVIGKFSIRIVPNMTPEDVNKCVTNYINKLWATRKSPNKLKVTSLQGSKPWLADYNHPHYQAGARAIKTVFGVEPDYTREGGSIPVTLTFQELTQKNVMLLPIGASDDMAHSQNEKINVSNYIQGTKTLAAYLLELGKL